MSLPSASSSSAKEIIHCSNVEDLPVPSLSSASVAEIPSSQQLAHLSHSPSNSLTRTLHLLIMALKCFTYNCRGWNNGSATICDFIDLFDLCFIQEHWLLTDQLPLLSSFHADFSALSVSGVSVADFVCGRPYGGCAILYRSSLIPSITPLKSTSNRFCALKIQDITGTSILLVNVCMPSQSLPTDYLDTLGVLEGFIESYRCDVVAIVGDFNFSRVNSSANYLSGFMASCDLVACDLAYYGNFISHTYERDDGCAHSWIDHILCNRR